MTNHEAGLVALGAYAIAFVVGLILRRFSRKHPRP